MAWHDRYQALHGDDATALAAARELGASGAEVVVVSACLLGERTRWDATDKLIPSLADVLADARFVVLPLCPEILGGMGCPRPAVRFTGASADGGSPAARVVDENGHDHTGALVRGAERATALAEAAGAKVAILKARSPSCGLTQVHQEGQVVPGRGAFAARLVGSSRLRLRVLQSEEDVLKL